MLLVLVVLFLWVAIAAVVAPERVGRGGIELDIASATFAAAASLLTWLAVFPDEGANLLLLLAPASVAALPLAVPSPTRSAMRVASALLLLAFSAVTSFSIGLFYTPAATAAAAAALTLGPRDRPHSCRLRALLTGRS
jgi:hypothetical protein